MLISLLETIWQVSVPDIFQRCWNQSHSTYTEVSLAENAEAMRAGKHDGWVSTCWDGIEESLDIVVEKSIKIIVNGGGLNPRGLAEKVQRLVGSRDR